LFQTCNISFGSVTTFWKRLLAGLALVASCDAAMSDDLIGQATVVDGDNPKSTATAFAFWGIDAPESTQFC
jgi:hypothetical protein